MATIHRFEDLEIWQLARVQCQSIAQLIKCGAFTGDDALLDQVNRTSGSVMDNIVEGFDRFSKADFRHFLVIARGSNAEVRSQLYRAGDRKYISGSEQQALIKASINLAVKISNLISHLTRSLFKTKPTAQKPEIMEEPNIGYSAINDDAGYNMPDHFIKECRE